MTKILQKAVVGGYGPTFEEAAEYLRDVDASETASLNRLITASYHACVRYTNRDLSETSITASVSSGSTYFLTQQYVYSVSTGSLENRIDGAYITFDGEYNGNVSYVVEQGNNSRPEIIQLQIALVNFNYENRNLGDPNLRTGPLEFVMGAVLDSYILNPIG